MSKKSVFIISLILSIGLIISGCEDAEFGQDDTQVENDEGYEVSRLFDEIYRELVNDDTIRTKEELNKLLDDRNDYDINYIEDINSYEIRDNLSKSDDYVYIHMTYDEDKINSISYNLTDKGLVVGWENLHVELDKEHDVFYGKSDSKKEFSGINEQIDFLHNETNERHEKIKANDKSDDPTELEFELNYKLSEGRLHPSLKTNLPDGTTGSFNLFSEELDYRAQSSFEVKNGEAIAEDSFSDNKNVLRRGSYKLQAYLPIADVQNEDVLVEVGKDYSNYKGEEIIFGEVGTIIETEIDIEIE